MSQPTAHFCGSPDHGVTRRGFFNVAGLAGATAFAANMRVMDVLKNPSLATELKRQQKSVILLWLGGGASQFETWDPKPGRPTGGPFRAIGTDIPSVQISELMPKMAQRLKTTALIRSLNTRNADHGGGTRLMETGRAMEQAVDYPDLGALIARELGRADSQVPDYVSMYSETEGRHKGGAGFLGARYAPTFLTESMIPPNIRRPESIAEIDHKERADLQKLLARRFSEKRYNASVASHGMAYEAFAASWPVKHCSTLPRNPRQLANSMDPRSFRNNA